MWNSDNLAITSEVKSSRSFYEDNAPEANCKKQDLYTCYSSFRDLCFNNGVKHFENKKKNL
jgi:hypothetical protein